MSHGSQKLHHAGLVSELDLAYTVAESLAEKGYAVCFDGRSSAVYDAQRQRVKTPQLSAEVEALAVEALDATADDEARHNNLRREARATAALIRTHAPGSVGYLRRVVALVRDELPPVDRDVVCPPRDRREYLADYHARVRNEALHKAQATARALLPDMIPAGKYELGDVWEGWCEELEDPDSGLLQTYPELTKLGRNHFYSLLAEMRGMRIAKGSGRRRYLYVK